MFDEEDPSFAEYLVSMGVLIVTIVVFVHLFVTYVVPFLAAL